MVTPITPEAIPAYENEGCLVSAAIERCSKSATECSLLLKSQERVGLHIARSSSEIAWRVASVAGMNALAPPISAAIMKL
jgi:hypothetical protein